ncbi:MAG: hypothetical protein NTZ02_04125 [Candidatus Woesearchaeota archaeon]|nr:hypothetical protein [Candidatus Woesearchaeota archaeon]
MDKIWPRGGHDPGSKQAFLQAKGIDGKGRSLFKGFPPDFFSPEKEIKSVNANLHD